MDIIERLRAVSQGYVVFLNDHGVYTEAADEIERLREEIEDMHRRERSTAVQNLGNEGQLCDEIERLRDALRKIVEFYDCLQSQKQEGDYDLLVWIARAALKEGE